MTPDMMNASFEILGGVFLAPSVLKAWRGKMIRGVHWTTPMFFWSWGLWNVFYYPMIGQPLSAWAGLIVFVVNTAWFGLVLKYGRER